MNALESLLSFGGGARERKRPVSSWRILWDDGTTTPVRRDKGKWTYNPTSPCQRAAANRAGHLVPTSGTDDALLSVADSVAPHGKLEQVHDDGRVLRTVAPSSCHWECSSCGKGGGP